MTNINNQCKHKLMYSFDIMRARDQSLLRIK